MVEIKEKPMKQLSKITNKLYCSNKISKKNPEKSPLKVLWSFRDQKEDTEEEKVGGTNVLNKQNIYTK